MAIPSSPALAPALVPALAKLLKLVRDAHAGRVDRHDAAQVDGRRDDDRIRAACPDGRLEVARLLRAVAHRGQQRAEVGVLCERVLERAVQKGARVDELLCAELARAAITPQPSRISPCVSVGPSSTTSTRLPRISAGSDTEKGEAASMTTARARVDLRDAVAHALDRGAVGRVHLVDDAHVRTAQVHLARVVAQLVARAVRVQHLWRGPA